jgi:hypothetical protein
MRPGRSAGAGVPLVETIGRYSRRACGLWSVLAILSESIGRVRYDLCSYLPGGCVALLLRLVVGVVGKEHAE